MGTHPLFRHKKIPPKKEKNNVVSVTESCDDKYRQFTNGALIQCKLHGFNTATMCLKGSFCC